MDTLEQVIATSPSRSVFDARMRISCIEACVACELTCLACADACLSEQEVHALKQCIRLNLQCAESCAATARMLVRAAATPELIRMQLDTCRAACATCGAECQRHSHHEHCKHCADACRRCEEACRTLTRSIPGAPVEG